MYNFESWFDLLTDGDVQLAYDLAERASAERSKGKAICPPQDCIFKALETTSPERLKAVIVGQDPYHTPGVANGLAFSVAPGAAIPPSLKNIFRELHDDIGCPIPASGDLTPWAKRGVLLLNTSLTVYEGRPGSHMAWGWQDFVLSVLRGCASLPQPVVFLLWGGHARVFTAGLQLSQRKDKAAIFSSHPSPLGATKSNGAVPAFLGSRPFSQTNRLLRAMGTEPIEWDLSD